MDRLQPQHDTMLTDDAVAELLAKEANDASAKYSSLGLEAFRSRKPTSKAKPNTRFLGRIIKETTSHNAALLAREAAEAQARLDGLTETEEKKRRKLNPTASDIRRRQLGDISSILQGRKRNDKGERQDGSRELDKGRDKDKARDPPRDRDGRRSKARARDEDKPESGSRRSGGDRTADERERQRRRRRSRSRSPRHSDRRHRDRSPLSSDTDDRRTRRGKSGKDRDLIGRGPARRRDYGRLREDDDDDDAAHARNDAAMEEDDSDPLEDLIGPAPPPQPAVRTRGRGAIRGAAAMDSRFSDAYDPASDVQLEPPDADDWDEAVETYRDRQKWKQQGAERLRAAGFTDEQIKKWEKGGEKDIDDVQWVKAGQKREWDRGKDLDEL